VRGLTGVRVMDISLPQAWSCHPGPQFGINGSRELMGVTQGPMVGSIIKPSLGLLPDETATVIAQLCEAGVDFIKDDEKLMSPGYSSLKDRVKAIMPVVDAHEQKTGKRVMYAFGISSADPDTMMRNHDVVLEAGGNAAVLNINSIGYGGMSFLRNVDQFQINGIQAKYWEPDESFVRSFQAVSEPIFSDDDKPLPVVGSGQWGGQAPETYQRTGRTLDLMYLCGGGVHGHPMGAAAGVRAIRQAWEAAEADVELSDYANHHPELKAALDKWG